MDFLSTKKSWKNNQVGKLDRTSIFANGRLRSLTIVSAYTDVDFIKTIKNSFTRHLDKRVLDSESKHLEIYLDDSASKYHTCDAIKDALNKLANEIKQKFDKTSGVFLVKCGALFHSKMVLSESNKNYKFVIGSINLTKKAFSCNEEIALACEWGKTDKTKLSKEYNEIKKSIECYLKKIRKSSKQLPDNDGFGKPESLRSLMMKGKLFQEYKEQESFSFDMAFPKEYREMLNNKTKTVYDFLGGSTSGSVSLSSLIDFAKLEMPSYFKKETDDEQNSTWKKYSIETCYGYWVPHDYLKLVNACLESRLTKKISKLKDLLEFLKKNNDSLRTAFKDCFKQVQNDPYLEKNIWKFSPYNEQKLEEEWDAWIGKIEKRIDFENPKYCSYISRLCKGCVEVQVPDVWSDDPVSSEEFEQSLYESLCYQFSVKNKIKRKICSALKLNENLKAKLSTTHF